MPTVGSTPTTTSPAPQQTSAPVAKRRPRHAKSQQQQQQQPQLQLQYQHYQPQQQQQQQPQQQHHSVTTTQPMLAGMFTHNNNNNNNHHNNHHHHTNNNNNNDLLSPISNSNSYSSVDTNQTLLNSIANHQRSQRQRQPQPQQQQQQPNRSPKYSQFMIITPAVSIDRDFDYDDSHLDFEDFANAAHNNGNLFRLGLRRSDSSSDVDSGSEPSDDSNSFRSNYNPYLHHSRQHLLAKGHGHGKNSNSNNFYAFTSSWRWCTLLCAAMRCFGAGTGHGNAPYSSSLQHHRLRRCSSYNAENAYEHFAAPFKARKTRDHLNNITYEL